MSFCCEKLLIYTSVQTIVDISFSFEHSFALIGESGSGKSLTLKALLGMLANNLTCEITCKNDFELKRGKTVAIVPQNPFTALSPLTKIQDQFFVADDVAAYYFKLVGLEKQMLTRFPSELSGGQLQRVVLAFALSLKPRLLLLDEPTTALDSKSKKEILELIARIQKEENFYLLFVTHDINAVVGVCEDVGILRGGKMIENGRTEEILQNPKNEYTKNLIEAGFQNRKFRL
ncbi:MAG: ABC transporter ATP-binding protein [Sulfurospirillum sp.]|nr:ABC transporter ATP-binding protein [Sulfurospirillum sp.]